MRILVNISKDEYGHSLESGKKNQWENEMVGLKCNINQQVRNQKFLKVWLANYIENCHKKQQHKTDTKMLC